MNHLNAVAEIQKNRILEALDRNEERLEKLTQDTTLHLSLSKYLESNDPLDLKKINSILNYNVDSINDFHAIALFSMDGTKITSIEKNNSEFPASLFFPEGKSKNFITITYDKNPVLFLSGPIIVKDKPIGVIVIESDAVTITSITQDHTGLGKTGETILAKRTLGNDALFVTPLRFDAEADFSKTIPQGKIEIPITQAMLSKEISLIDATDYRGEKVMAVTKHIPHVDWGLVSKIDTSEVYSIRNGTTVFLVGIVIIMSGILTSMSLLLSENILKPVSRLKSHINQLTKGNFKNKIPLEGDNEISSLAETVAHLQISLDKSNHETIIFEKKLQQQLHARNELKRAMDESAGVAITDPDGVIISVNDLVVKMSKYDKREIIGNTHQIFNSKFHTDGFFKNMWQTISQGKVWHGLIKNKAKDGSYFWIKNTITPLVGDDGKIQQYIAIWTDITKQRRNEDTLSITLKALKNAEKLKDEFATMVSHELKTPLTPIKFNTEMLLEDNVLGTLNQSQRESVEDIEINAIRLEKLIGDILSAQKLDMKKMVFNKNKFNTDDLLKNVRRNSESLLKDKKINLQIINSYSGEIFSDKDRIQQVLENFVKNSIDFVPEKQGKIIIEIYRQKDSIIFYVKDNGCGIPKKAQENLFKKFYQANTSHTRKHGGTGLGLAICRGFVEGLGGKIWFESEEGKGTTFFFSIPIKQNVEVVA